MDAWAEPLKAVVSAENGKPVKMRKKATTKCGLYWKIPCGTEVEVLKEGGAWCRIRAMGRTGYMMREFLKMER